MVPPTVMAFKLCYGTWSGVMLVVTLPTSNLFNAVSMHMAIFLAIRTLDGFGLPFTLLNYVYLTVNTQLAIFRFL